MVICLCFSMRDFDEDKWFRPPKPYLVVDPDHCVVERHVNEYEKLLNFSLIIP